MRAIEDMEIKEIIRLMLTDWDRFTDQEREDAITEAATEFLDRRHRVAG